MRMVLWNYSDVCELSDRDACRILVLRICDIKEFKLPNVISMITTFV
jgi:hypothetical protein